MRGLSFKVVLHSDVADVGVCSRTARCVFRGTELPGVAETESRRNGDKFALICQGLIMKQDQVECFAVKRSDFDRLAELNRGRNAHPFGIPFVEMDDGVLFATDIAAKTYLFDVAVFVDDVDNVGGNPLGSGHSGETDKDRRVHIARIEC